MDLQERAPGIFHVSSRYLPVLRGFYDATGNMPPLAFGIHNKLYDYSLGVVIYGL